MKPQPVFNVTGVVATVRTIEVPAREATATARAFAGTTYAEVDVLSDESLLGDDVIDIPSVFTLRVPAAAAEHYSKGVVVDEKCTVVNVLLGRPGKWFNDLRFRPVRWAGMLADAPAAVPA